MKRRRERFTKLILIFNCNSMGRRAGRAISACFQAFLAWGRLILKVIFNVNLNVGRGLAAFKPAVEGALKGAMKGAFKGA
jgi:hypothetical protein